MTVKTDFLIPARIMRSADQDEALGEVEGDDHAARAVAGGRP